MEQETKKKNFDYINNYQKNNYDRITIIRKKGEKDKLTKIAKEKNFNSLTDFINTCINEKLKRMKIEL